MTSDPNEAWVRPFCWTQIAASDKSVAAVPKQKLYAYVDESRQDTEGDIFVVSIVLLEGQRELVRQQLEEIESQSGKGVAKWHKSRHEFRVAYVEALVELAELRHRAFVEVFRESKEYLELTALSAAKAILKGARPP